MLFRIEKYCQKPQNFLRTYFFQGFDKNTTQRLFMSLDSPDLSRE